MAFTLLAILLMSAQMALAADAASETLQKGLFEEEANHNLDAAIKAYQAVIARHDEQRKLVATAVFRLGECYRKLGRANEATAQYQRILREFSDQAPLVALSRSYVQTSALAQSAQTTPGQSGDRELLAYLKGLNTAELRKALPGVVSDPLLNKLAKQFAETEQNLAALEVTFAPEHPDVKKVLVMLKTINAQIDERQDGILKGLEARVAASTAAEGTSPALAGATDEEEKEVKRIKALIKDSPDLINSPDSKGYTPLHTAAELGQLVVARFLLANKADVNAHSKRPDLGNSGTPLHLAASRGHKTMTELLLASGADVNAEGTVSGIPNSMRTTTTPLHSAVANGYKSVVEALIANKANVNARNSNGQTPLHAAAEAGNKPIAELLLSTGAEIEAKDSIDRTPLHFAASKGHLPLVDLFLTRKADVNASGQSGTPVVWTVDNNYWKVAEALLDHGADVNAKAPNGDSLLHLALGKKSVEMLKLILVHKPDLEGQNQQKYTPLQRAVAQGDSVELVRLLLASGANANALFSPGTPPVNLSPNPSFAPAGSSPLIVAIRKRLVEVVEALLATGANVKAKSPEGKTPLHYAVEAYSLPMVAAVLARQPDLEARDNDGSTPLLTAVGWGVASIVEALIGSGADVNAAYPSSGSSALHAAAMYVSRDLVELLVTNKANVNVMNKEGDTPLVLAQRRSRNPGEQAISSEIAALLLKHGADENLRRRSFIMVGRAERNWSDTLLYRGTNDYNRHTLLELVASFYSNANRGLHFRWAFPDFANVKIKRTGPKTKGSRPDLLGMISFGVHDYSDGRDYSLDLETILKSSDCSKDPPLEWGDIVEIPELDHRANEQWPGLSKEISDTIIKCLKRTVQITVKGETNMVLLVPEFKTALATPLPAPGSFQDRLRSLPPPAEESWKTQRSFRLKPVLQGANVIRVSSDLSRVKVKRVDSASGQSREMLFDLSDKQPYDERTDLWLRDGDVIEVPEK